MAGGTILWMVLMILAGSAGGFFVVLIFGSFFFVPLSAKAGLATDPLSLKPASPPMFGGLVGVGFRWQDRLGDFILTNLWNAVRHFTDVRF